MKKIITDDLQEMTEIAMSLTEKGAAFEVHKVNGSWLIEITGY